MRPMTPGERRRRAWELSVPAPPEPKPPPPPPKVPVVYFVQAGEFVKIGKSTDWRARIAGLQTGSPHVVVPLLVLPATPNAERLLHYQFAEHRINGEWFRPAAEIMAYIEEHRADGLPLEEQP